VRLFVAVWPPPDVVRSLEDQRRAPVEGVRWTTPDQWHVTLRFFGEVEDARRVVERLRGVLPAGATAVMGPSSRRLGSGVLCLPVAGLDVLARATLDATADIGAPPESRPFFGHVTLARLRRPGRLPVVAVGASWPVVEVAVVRSHLGRGGARYEIVERVPCGR
jgi:2'-5' RNA ligase